MPPLDIKLAHRYLCYRLTCRTIPYKWKTLSASFKFYVYMLKYSFSLILVSFYFRVIRMIQPICRGVLLVGVSAMYLISLGLCCDMTENLPQEDYYCNTERDLDLTNTESFELCQMACIFNANCKAISYDTQSTICTRHTMPCLFPYGQVGVVYQSLVTLNANSKCPRRLWRTQPG